MNKNIRTQPKISIITVSYNNETTIMDTIKSVQAQEYVDYEHLIIDGSSTDKTLAKIEQVKTSQGQVISEPDDGIYFAMNKGIELARGDIIGFINADDILANDQVFSRVASIFSENKQATDLVKRIDACYADLVYVKADNLDKIVRYWRSNPFVLENFSSGWSPPHPTFYARKECYQEFGQFDLSYKMGNDIELMMRFMERFRIHTQYVPEVWVKMRLGGVSNQSIKNIFLQNLEIYHGARKNRVPFFVPEFIFGKIKDRISQYISH